VDQTRPELPPRNHSFRWFGSGAALLGAQLAAIAQAKRSLRLETYIFADSNIGRQFRDALTDAARRGMDVAVLADRFGSARLPRDFFAPLHAAGGRQTWFNPPRPGRWALRDHRKLLLVDETCAYLGGCNIADEYTGDGIEQGWRDGGISVEGPIVSALAAEFDRQWERANQETWRLIRGGYCQSESAGASVTALFIKPGFGANPLRTWLREDLKQAQSIDITAAYFLPTRRLRAQLIQADRRGARVRLLLAGKSDVPLMLAATRSLHRQLIGSGVEIFEYVPQILHAKTLVLDDVVYVGSSNLDPRSLRLNFEIMLRVKDAQLAAQARAQFEADLRHSRTIPAAAPSYSIRSIISRSWQRTAYLIFTRLDPWIAREQLHRHTRWTSLLKSDA